MSSENAGINTELYSVAVAVMSALVALTRAETVSTYTENTPIDSVV